MFTNQNQLPTAIVKARLEGNYQHAAQVLENEDEFERLLSDLEKKLHDLPVVGDTFVDLPVVISLARAYIKKEYTDISTGSIIAVVAAMIYIVDPSDLINDYIPVVGVVDDLAIIALVLSLISSDLEKYKQWRAAREGVVSADAIEVQAQVIE